MSCGKALILCLPKMSTVLIDRNKIYLWYALNLNYILIVYQGLINLKMSQPHLEQYIFFNFNDSGLSGGHSSQPVEALLTGKD